MNPARASICQARYSSGMTISTRLVIDDLRHVRQGDHQLHGAAMLHPLGRAHTGDRANNSAAFNVIQLDAPLEIEGGHVLDIVK